MELSSSRERMSILKDVNEVGGTWEGPGEELELYPEQHAIPLGWKH